MQSENVILVSNACFLKAGGGGVQWCTREYLATLQSASASVHTIPYETDSRLISKFSRFFSTSPFEHFHHPRLVDEILETADLKGIDWIFLNNVDAAVLAPKLRAAKPGLKIAYLSHGVELTDVVNNLRLAKGSISSANRSSQWLGNLIKLEIAIRNAVDAVICISEEDMAFEQWLGSQHTLFIPRQVPLNPLPLRSVARRMGTVSTLDHGPNLDGIRKLAQQLDLLNHVELRLVGGPEAIGRDLQRQFHSIHYLGRLSDSDLKMEASTWTAFINPIFCHARGASTKVATALGWGLPVLTTQLGARGYRWDRDALPISDSPELLADACSRLADLGCHDQIRANTEKVAKLAPSIHDSAQMLSSFLKTEFY